MSEKNEDYEDIAPTFNFKMECESFIEKHPNKERLLKCFEICRLIRRECLFCHNHLDFYEYIFENRKHNPLEDLIIWWINEFPNLPNLNFQILCCHCRSYPDIIDLILNRK